MPDLDATSSTALMFTDYFLELIKSVKGGLKKLEVYPILKKMFLRKFLFSED